MPYIVTRGEVHAGAQIYAVGDELPDGIGDEAMVEAGAIEWREPKAKKGKANADKHVAGAAD